MRNGAKDCLTRAPDLLTCRAGDPPLEHRLRPRRLPQRPPSPACEPGPGSRICPGHVAAREPAATTCWRHRDGSRFRPSYRLRAGSTEATSIGAGRVGPLWPQGFHRCRTAEPSTGTGWEPLRPQWGHCVMWIDRYRALTQVVVTACAY